MISAIISFFKKLFGLLPNKPANVIIAEKKIEKVTEEIKRIENEKPSTSDNVDFINDLYDKRQ